MKRSIIANESRILRHIMRRILEQRGYDVIEACDGPETVDLCQQGMPDLLCVDECLPDIDGVSVLRLLRAEQVGSSMPPVLFTYLENDRMLMTRARTAGAGVLLQTPFTAAQMDDALRTLC